MEHVHEILEAPCTPEGLAFTVAVGHLITATAISPSGNTSEFSECFAVSACTLDDFGQTVLAQDKNTLAWTAGEDAKFVKGPVSGVSTYATTDDGTLSGATSLSIFLDNPGGGTGVYYLLRLQDCGSWQTTVGAEPDRDAELQ